MHRFAYIFITVKHQIKISPLLKPRERERPTVQPTDRNALPIHRSWCEYTANAIATNITNKHCTTTCAFSILGDFISLHDWMTFTDFRYGCLVQNSPNFKNFDHLHFHATVTKKNDFYSVNKVYRNYKYSTKSEVKLAISNGHNRRSMDIALICIIIFRGKKKSPCQKIICSKIRSIHLTLQKKKHTTPGWPPLLLRACIYFVFATDDNADSNEN